MKHGVLYHSPPCLERIYTISVVDFYFVAHSCRRVSVI